MCSLGGWARGCRPGNNKPCCLFWCCCCSCTCASETDSPKKHSPQHEPTPELEPEPKIEPKVEPKVEPEPEPEPEPQQALLEKPDEQQPSQSGEADFFFFDGPPDPEQEVIEEEPEEEIELPEMDEIIAWGTSFDRMMRHEAGRKIFRKFLRSEYSEENILFWLACEDLKLETNKRTIEEKVRFIYDDYISILSPKEVSLDSRVREITNRNITEPSIHSFDEAQQQIYTLMKRDSYPRFVNSTIYKTISDQE